MTLENAILELAKSITFHAETFREVKHNPEVSKETTKIQKKFKAKQELEVKQELEIKQELETPEYTMLVGDDIPSEVKHKQENETPEQILAKEKFVVGFNMQIIKDLAKEKMALGVERSVIKNLITDLGVESIAELCNLSDEAIIGFHNKLKDLN